MGIESPWHMIDAPTATVEVVVEFRGEPCCPCCTKASACYENRRRVFRHLDTYQYKTHLLIDVPWIECEEHGVMQIDISWAERNSRFTALLKCMVIEWLKEANFSTVARRMNLGWDEVDGIISRAAARGLVRGEKISPTRIGVDKTSFQKRHACQSPSPRWI